MQKKGEAKTKIDLYEKNAKKHPDKQLKLIAKSIKRFGWQQPIKVGKGNIIIVGHGRWMAYEKYKDELGLKEAWVIDEKGSNISGEPEKRKLTEKEEKAYRLADNKINESDWDMDLVVPELKELDNDLVDLTGFDNDLLIEPDAKDDEVPDVPEEPKAKLGDIYQLGNHRIMCGDSTKIEDVEKLMDGKKADMVFTDPPYGINMKRSGSILNDTIDGLEKLLKDSFTSISVYSKQNVPLYCWIGFKAYSIAEGVIGEIWKITNCIVWKKPSIGLGKAGYRYQHELCIFSGNLKSNNQSDVWEFNRDSSSKHPTMKPVELVVKAIKNSSGEEDIVLDTFLGGGSTLIACEKTNRICYGMELDPKYIDVIIKRWEDYTNNKAIKINE